MKPRKDKPNRDAEIILAKKARQELLKLIIPNNSAFDNAEIKKKEDICLELEKNKKLVIVKCLEFDKYGRLLVELFNQESIESFNSMLIAKNLSVTYDGGKKINPWTQAS